METVCSRDMCTGCMLCSDLCPAHAVSVETGLKACNAWIDGAKCIGCGLCHRQCPQNRRPDLKPPVAWYQGWSVEPGVRAGSSSGGVAMELSRKFIENGGEVCACCLSGGTFRFSFFDSVEGIKRTAGSKYVKSSPEGIYRPLLKRLKSGRKVLMVALPCQVAAARNYLGGHDGGFYAVDLICHGTPALETLRIYLEGRGIALSQLQDVRFRRKGSFQLQADYEMVEKYHMDAYTYAFLNCLTYTENCYSCGYARTERVSDITIGDSWGSELEENERQKGISLILCQTEKGKELLEMADLELKDVDLEKAIAANRQLTVPSAKAKGRDVLFDGIQKGKGFEWMLYRIDPVRGVKNLVRKYILKRPYKGKPHSESKGHSQGMAEQKILENTCICCGAPVPEGRQVCWACENGKKIKVRGTEKEWEREHGAVKGKPVRRV